MCIYAIQRSGAYAIYIMSLTVNNSMHINHRKLSTLLLSERELDSFVSFYSGYLRIVAVLPARLQDQYCVLSDIDSESRLRFYLSY